MEKMSTFKDFVRKNPILSKYVKNNEMTWQKFYELYDLYGEENAVWDEYLQNGKKIARNDISNNTLSEFMNFVKKVDLDNLQESILSVQRVVGVISDLLLKKDNDTNINEYKPRPLYKHFDD